MQEELIAMPPLAMNVMMITMGIMIVAIVFGGIRVLACHSQIYWLEKELHKARTEIAAQAMYIKTLIDEKNQMKQALDQAHDSTHDSTHDNDNDNEETKQEEND